jgi:hypothetical protein
MFLQKAAIVAAGTAAIVIAETPIPFVDEFTKFGVCGALVLVIYWLMNKHEGSLKDMGAKLDGVKDAIERSSERQCDVMRSVLTSEERQREP